jgi:cell division protein FtsW (lipid II flippase)
MIKNYRWKELGLFIIPFIILLLIMFQLPLAQYYETQLQTNSQHQIPLTLSILPTIHDLIPILGLIIALFAVNVLISFFFPKADQVLLPLVGLMSGIGVMMATRLQAVPRIQDPNLGTRQLVWVIVGLVACVVTLFALRRMGWLRNYKYVWAALGIILVAFTLIHAFRVKNFNSPNHDQLNFGPLSLQPSELLKIIIAIFFAAYLDETTRDVFSGTSRRFGPIPIPPLDKLGVMGSMLGISLVLFLGIRELGLALLIYGIFLTMLYLGSGKISYVVVGLLVFFVLGFIGYTLFGYVRDRFTAVTIDVVNWQNWTQNTVTYVNSFGGPRQVIEGLIALANGGIIGSGIGLGHAGEFGIVVQSDMILTALGEELGLAGLFAIIGIYMLIIYRGYRIAIEATNDFSQLLAAGLTSIFAIQALVIMAGNMKFLPLTGIPLPFLSYGGSSIIANYIIIGILLRISHNTAVEREGRG